MKRRQAMRKHAGSGWSLSKIPVLEIFGPTIQGEGMVIGQKTMFVRTAGCDYRCAWCDTAYTWDGSSKNLIRRMTAEEIWQELQEIGKGAFSHVTITGGNPALYSQLAELVTLLKKNHITTALETQGSKWQDWFYDIDDLTLSPKPPSSMMTTDFSMLDEIVDNLTAFRSAFSLKIVVFDDDDYEYARNIYQRYSHVPFYLQTGNENLSSIEQGELLRKLLEKYEWLVSKAMNDSLLKDVRILPQLHTYLWGNQRGV